MSPNECLNNIILERTIEYNTTRPKNSTAKESNEYPGGLLARQRRGASERVVLVGFATRFRGFAAQFSRPQREKKPLAPRVETESTWKERLKSTWPTHLFTCSSQVITRLSYGTSLLAVTVVKNYDVT